MTSVNHIIEATQKNPYWSMVSYLETLSGFVEYMKEFYCSHLFWGVHVQKKANEGIQSLNCSYHLPSRSLT